MDDDSRTGTENIKINLEHFIGLESTKKEQKNKKKTKNPNQTKPKNHKDVRLSTEHEI